MRVERALLHFLLLIFFHIHRLPIIRAGEILVHGAAPPPPHHAPWAATVHWRSVRAPTFQPSTVSARSYPGAVLAVRWFVAVAPIHTREEADGRGATCSCMRASRVFNQHNNWKFQQQNNNNVK